MFAGPNGSGKSTVFREIQTKYNLHLGTYLNADDIEKQLVQNKLVDLTSYGLNPESLIRFDNYVESHSLLQKALSEGYELKLTSDGHYIKNSNEETHSYEAAMLVDFMRNELIENGIRVTCETVMSHPSKVEVLKKAQDLGFKNYLYFISTQSVEVNKNRVRERVLNGGHDVPEEKIERRYTKSLELLSEAVKYTYRSFIFDNSGEKSKLILDVLDGSRVTIREEIIPEWVDKYLLNGAQKSV
jgi:predicted ABC-type ATPase